MKPYFRFLSFFVLAFLIGFSTLTQAQPEGGKPKNVVLFIGDGMGLTQVQVAQLMSDKPMHILGAPYVGFATTNSFDSDVTDSAAGGTAIATGVKTRNGMVGMDPDSTEIPSMLDIFGQNGYATGVVVSCGITHATPASFLAKAINRNHYEDIALSILKSPVDVMIGGGRKHFDERKDGQKLTRKFQEKGFTYLEKIPETLLPEWKKLLILTDNDHPKSMQEGRGDHLPSGVALALKQLVKNPKGFFLMVEGSQIDWACHANDSSYLLAEMYDFDKAVGEALQFSEAHPETLVVITADHETGGLTLPKGVLKGSFRCAFSTGDHTGVMVPVYAFGPGAEKFTGIFDNTDLIRKILCLTGMDQAHLSK